MNDDLISRRALKESIRKRLCIRSLNYLMPAEKVIVDEIDNAPTGEPKLSDEQIEKITDLLETEWGYEGIREDVSRILKGERQ